MYFTTRCVEGGMFALQYSDLWLLALKEPASGNSNVIPMGLHLHADYQNLAINQMIILEINEWDAYLLNDWFIGNFIW